MCDVIRGDPSDKLAFGKRRQGRGSPYSSSGTEQGVRAANRKDLRQE